MINSLIYEGKAKKVYQTSVKDEVLIEFKNSLTAGDGVKKGSFEGKGFINAQVTSSIFSLLTTYGIENHFLNQENPNSLRCRRVTILPIEVVVRNICAGSFSRRYNKPEGEVLGKPLVELFLKDDSLHDPLITDDAAIALKTVTELELSYIKTVALQINKILQQLFVSMNLKLVDFKLEFGKDVNNHIILADEITQDTMRLWDEHGDHKDKDRFRRDLGRVQETYEEFFAQLTQKISFMQSTDIAVGTVAQLIVVLKDGIIDAVGDVTRRSLEHLGYKNIDSVHAGKFLTLKIRGPLNNQFITDIFAMNQQLLSNPLIEKMNCNFLSV